MKKAWRPFGVGMTFKAPGVKSIIEWGTKPYAEANRRSSRSVESDKRSKV
jgi:hypothetical protein